MTTTTKPTLTESMRSTLNGITEAIGSPAPGHIAEKTGRGLDPHEFIGYSRGKVYDLFSQHEVRIDNDRFESGFGSWTLEYGDTYLQLHVNPDSNRIDNVDVWEVKSKNMIDGDGVDASELSPSDAFARGLDIPAESASGANRTNHAVAETGELEPSVYIGDPTFFIEHDRNKVYDILSKAGIELTNDHFAPRLGEWTLEFDNVYLQLHVGDDGRIDNVDVHEVDGVSQLPEAARANRTNRIAERAEFAEGDLARFRNTELCVGRVTEVGISEMTVRTDPFYIPLAFENFGRKAAAVMPDNVSRSKVDVNGDDAWEFSGPIVSFAACESGGMAVRGPAKGASESAAAPASSHVVAEAAGGDVQYSIRVPVSGIEAGAEQDVLDSLLDAMDQYLQSSEGNLETGAAYSMGVATTDWERVA